MGAGDAFEGWIAAAEAALPAQLRAWTDTAARRRVLGEELAEAMAWTERMDWAEQFARRCPVEGAAPADYLSRRVVLATGAEAVLGPRFFDLDPARPFVEVLAWSRPPGLADLEALRAVAEQSVFAPTSVRVFLSGTGPHGATAWRRFVAAPLRLLRHTPPSRDVALAPADAEAVYGRYQQAYASLAEAPHWRPEFAQPESLGTLTEASRGQRLFDIQIDGQWHGLVGVQPRSLLGVEGLEVLEIVLDTFARGRRLAASVLQCLHHSVAASDDTILFGTIHAGNVPALRSARRSGRVDLGGWWLLPLERTAAGTADGPARLQ